ncbi:RNA-binding S4 domain-containing protein [Candidatus Woesearchaeota archaeon]|nr:RNA-binding S4 domain-containing protein [Candidatus Woesearchaeota archaeon]
MTIIEKYIELNAFIKLKGLATTSGRAKLSIRSGKVLVNGMVETRNRKKLVAGDKVSVEGKEFIVEEKVCLKVK